MIGKGSGKYAAVTALLIGLTAFLSVLLLSPRFGGDRSKFPVSGFMVLVSLLGAVPRAHAFVGSGSLLVSRLRVVSPPASRLATTTTITAAAAARPVALGHYRVRGAAPAHTNAAAPALTSLTGSWALFVSGGAADVASTTGRGKVGGMASDAGEGLMKHVLVPIADGSEEIESVTIIDTLVRAGAAVTVASVADGVEVTCSRGVVIKADCRLAECEQRDWDAVVCPGGMPGATHLKENAALEAILRKQHSDGRIVAAICAAPAVVLAAHGLLEGRKATCYPANAFTATIPLRVDEKVVVDGNLITSQGPATSMAFALQLVDSLYGPDKAKEIGGGMLFT